MLKVLVAFALIFISSAHAEFTVPALTGPVVDAAQVLKADTVKSLSAFLRRVYEQGGTQVQVVILPDLGGLSVEEVGIRLADEWKIGRNKQDDGVILLLAMAERRVRIEVGKGREGDLPDLKASRIIREVIVPRLRAGTVDRAIVDGARAILHYTDPNLVSGGHANAPELNSGVDIQVAFFFVFILLALILNFMSSRMRGRGVIGGYTSGYYGGGGGFGSGGFGGGGWSGGGGGFSGGGSSGSW